MPGNFKLFNKTDREIVLPKSFLEAIINLIPKPDKILHINKTKTTGQFLNKHRHKFFKIMANKYNETNHQFLLVFPFKIKK